MSELTYREALGWIYGFSNTERTGAFVHDREDNLRRERALLAALGNPQRAYGISHIAGTKGKGSTSALLTAILCAAGIRTGLYSSPDLHTFRERMRVDGALIAEEEVARLVPRIAAALETLDPSLGNYITWEIATALAFLYFREAGARHAVVEVGLGGRLDATNVVEPLVTVITSISYDHMAVLGNTLGAIAGEKAGIIKPGVPLVTSAQAPEALDVIARVAAERGAPLLRVGPAGSGAEYGYRAGPYDAERQFFTVTTPHGSYADLDLRLLGAHQLENATAAIAAAEALRTAGLLIPEAAIRAGLVAARWPARMQVVAHAPDIVVDGAHNADSFARLFAGLRRHFTFDRLLLVLGLMADKDLPGIAHEIAATGADRVFASGWNNPRAATPDLIADRLRTTIEDAPSTDAHHARLPSVATFGSVGDALAAARADATPRDLICVTGSVAFAGEALRWLAANIPETADAIEIAGVDH
jgi:dihydrofolate synthase/folylpolyglutamate synthase